MKNTRNWVIAGVVVAVIGFIGWLLYNDSKTASTPSVQTPSFDTAAQPKDNDPHVVNLQNRSLTSIGAEVYGKSGITGVILSNNKLTSLPAEISRLTDLTALVVDHNQLASLPASIAGLTKLEMLDLGDNTFSTLPGELSSLKQLKVIVLKGNPLTVDQIDKIKKDLPNTQVVF